MSNDLINLLSNSNKDIDNQKLMDYVSNKLSTEENHEIEKLMVESNLINDAVEGLEQFNNKKNLTSFVDQLNADLRKQLLKKIQRKQQRRLKEQPWLYLTIIIIFLLIIVAFIVITKSIESHKNVQKSASHFVISPRSPSEIKVFRI